MSDGIIKLPSATTKTPQTPTKEELAKRPWCHRMYVPVSVVMQTQAAPNLPPSVETKTDLSFMKCMHEQCALFVSSLKKCGDLVSAEANLKMAEMAELRGSEAKLLDVTPG